MTLYTLGILEKNSKILLLLRKNSPYFSGYYGLPGGKVELEESPIHAIIREMQEELGITITQSGLQFTHCLTFKNEKGEKIVALVFKITAWHGELVNQEPDKCTELAWYAHDALPDNVIPRHRQIIEMIQQNILYSENGW